MVKKIRKLRESEEEIEMKESEEVKDVEMNEEDEMSAVREACAKIHEKANKIKEEDENKELDVVFGDIKESLDDIKESLDKLVAEEDEIKESEEEMSLEEEIEEIKESLDKLVAEEDEKLMEEVSDDKVEEIKESLDKLVAEEEMSLEEAEEIRDELKDLAESLDKLVAEEEMIEESEEEMVEEDEKETIEESVNRIFKKSRLSESTKQAIVTLIEAKVKEETEEKIKEIEEKAEEYGEYVKSEIEEKADAYLTDVAEEWVEENKLAVEEGVKSEIAESIMTGFKKVLAENNIFIPENKRDLLEETLSVNKRLQNKLGEKLATIAKLQEEKKSLLKYKLIEENSKELSLAQKSKLTNLLENVNYRNEDELVRKINVLKENYLSTARPSVNESTSRKVATRSTQNDSIYESYANFIEKSAK